MENHRISNFWLKIKKEKRLSESSNTQIGLKYTESEYGSSRDKRPKMN